MHIMKKDNYHKPMQQIQKVKEEIEMCDARAAGCLGPGWTVNCKLSDYCQHLLMQT